MPCNKETVKSAILRIEVMSEITFDVVRDDISVFITLMGIQTLFKRYLKGI